MTTRIVANEPKKTCIAAIYDRCDMIRRIHYPPLKRKGGQKGKNSGREIMDCVV